MPNDSNQFQFQEIIRAEVGDSSNETLIMIVGISNSENSSSVFGSQPIKMIRQEPETFCTEGKWSSKTSLRPGMDFKPYN